MGQLVVVAYPEEQIAEQARDKILQLQKQALIGLDDAVVVVRRPNGKVKIKQSVSLAGSSALSGAFWGMLIGFIFLMPVLGALVGATTGALSGKMVDLGIDDRFIKEVGAALQPGTSALFLLIHQVTPDRVISEMKEFGGKIIQTNLSDADETALQEAFAAA
ncbi:MAG TPA: DUF1269 domain-containing protein [Thermomicrobiales bacterium]